MARSYRHFGIAAILVATAVVYGFNLDHPFQYDDENKIVHDPRIRHPLCFFQAFTQGVYKEEATRLIPNLTFSLNYLIGGREPFVYNLTNLLIHLLNIWLVSRLGRAVLQRMGVRGSPIPLLAALIFALHPLNTEAVNYCNARPNTIVTAFYISALLALLRGTDSAVGRSSGRRSAGPWITFSIFVIAALFSKEMAKSILLIVIPFLYWVGGRKGERYQALFPWGWMAVIPLIAVGVGISHLTTAVKEVERTFDVGKTLAPNWFVFLLLNALGQSEVLMEYFWLALLPLPGFLNADHEIKSIYERVYSGGKATETLAYTLKTPLFCATALLAVIAFAVFLRLRNRGRFASLFILWAFIAHAPTSLIPRGEIMVEYRTYLPMAGLCLVFAWAVEKGLRFFSKEGLIFNLRFKTFEACTACILGLLLIWGTVVRNIVWRTRIGFWTDTALKSPTRPRAHYNLGTALGDAGRFDEAKAHLREAVRLNPRYAEAYNNLGVIGERTGTAEDAVQKYVQALQLQPDNPVTHRNLGVVLGRNGRYEEALRHLTKATRLKPDDTEAYNALGVVFERMNRLDDAETNYSKAIQLNPASGEAHYNLGVVYGKKGQIDRAITCYTEAIRLQPDFPTPHNNLGAILAGQHKLSEAIAQFEAALRLNPNYPEAHNNYASLLMDTQKHSEALAHLQTAIKIKPDYPDAYFNMGLVLARMGRIEDSIAACKEAIRIRPEYAEAHNSLASMLVQRPGQPPLLNEVLNHFQEALKYKPDYPEAHFNIGFVLATNGFADEALKHLQEAVKLKPDYPKAHNLLGEVLMSKQRVDEAIVHFSKALDLQPDFPEARDNLAKAKDRKPTQPR